MVPLQFQETIANQIDNMLSGSPVAPESARGRGEGATPDGFLRRRPARDRVDILDSIVWWSVRGARKS
ncbi:Hypothetical protein BN69_3447 [Methylocystis sp. SC2]|nr:Hypothetical protein BN69_3447 [Methylocystis sp. SC2]